MNVEVELIDGKKVGYQFDELESIKEERGYFVIKHIAGFTLLDKRNVKSVKKV